MTRYLFYRAVKGSLPIARSVCPEDMRSLDAFS